MEDRGAGGGDDAGGGGLGCGGELGVVGPDLDAEARVPGDLAAQRLRHRPQGHVGHAVFRDRGLAQGEAVDVDAGGAGGDPPRRDGEEGEREEETSYVRFLGVTKRPSSLRLWCSGAERKQSQ